MIRVLLSKVENHLRIITIFYHLILILGKKKKKIKIFHLDQIKKIIRIFDELLVFYIYFKNIFLEYIFFT